MNKRIAITGATGFVGGHLLNKLLSCGYMVNALTRRSHNPIENVNWIMGDLHNIEALKELTQNVDAVINVAGLVKAKSVEEFSQANSTAVATLVDIVKEGSSDPHVIQISSLAAREPQISNYASSKYEGEEYIRNNSVEINWTIVRPPGIYGKKDTETLKIFKALKWRLALYPANKYHRVSWINISDLAEAIILLIENKQYYSRTLEIDDGRKNGYSHEEFYNISADIMDVNPITITVPYTVLKLFGHINDIMGRIFGFAPMVSSNKVNELCHNNWVCRQENEFKITEWHARTELETGLKETLDWYKNNEYI